MSESSETSSPEGEQGSISTRNLTSTRQPGAARIRRAVRTALAEHPVRSMSIALVDDATIASLHEQYMNDPSPTDVLSFDLRDDPDDSAIDGEVVVSVDTARRQAAEFGTVADQEILRYVIHGTLHLLGFDDATPGQRQRMRREEDRILEVLTD